MQSIIIRLFSALATFLLSVALVQLSHPVRPAPASSACPAQQIFDHRLSSESYRFVLQASWPELNAEDAKIVAQAQYFIAWNGFTDQEPGGTGKLYFEPGENPDYQKQIWERRYATLEGKAYGLIKWENERTRFWTVVFRYTERARVDRNRIGLAYTLGEDRFGQYVVGLRKDFSMSKVKQRL
jgi:hypothetical protein